MADKDINLAAARLARDILHNASLAGHVAPVKKLEEYLAQNKTSEDAITMVRGVNPTQPGDFGGELETPVLSIVLYEILRQIWTGLLQEFLKPYQKRIADAAVQKIDNTISNIQQQIRTLSQADQEQVADKVIFTICERLQASKIPNNIIDRIRAALNTLKNKLLLSDD